MRVAVEMTDEKLLYQRARRLRREQTSVEAKLWRKLRGRRFAGFKFRRQHPIEGYIADFCCSEKRLIIELDGGQHVEQAQYDNERTAGLQSFGYRVMRFWNGEISENLDGVIEAIYAELNRPSP
ncbi:MAG: endonuclease domain-containing protein [Candidatus Binataceae bacterium]